MKIGIFDPYLTGPFGGGERYVLTLAEKLAEKGNEVNIFWDNPNVKEMAAQKLKINLKAVRFIANIFKDRNIYRRWLNTRNYDIIFYLSDGSIPFLFAKKNFIHMQVPLTRINGKSLGNKIKNQFIKAYVCNSKFTKHTIDDVFGVNSKVLYPPVAVEAFYLGKKEKIILGVGRFTQAQHAKKQHILVQSFINLCRQGLKDWSLILAGGSMPADKEYLRQLEKMAKGYPIKILVDISFKELQEWYSKASIFWHAAGFGEDEKIYPERMEHFGIVVVEAMAAGCVPVVINKGGIPEIIKDGNNGYLWDTIPELEGKTLKLINSPEILNNLSKKIVNEAKKFDNKEFINNALKIFKD